MYFPRSHRNELRTIGIVGNPRRLPTNGHGSKRIRVTGATGKVGRTFIERGAREPKLQSSTLRALCHQRSLPVSERLEVITGTIERRDVVEEGVARASHVLHLATSKESPETILTIHGWSGTWVDVLRAWSSKCDEMLDCVAS